MTQHDVAERLDCLAVLLQRRHVGVNADMVSKWERGQKQPSARYVRLLAELFDVEVEELGFIGTPAGGLEAEPAVDAGRRLSDVLEVLDGDPTSVELLQPKIIELWRQELLDRRQVLRAMGLVPVMAGLDGALPSHVARPAFRGEQTLTDLARVASRLEWVYHSCDPEQLVVPVGALIETIEQLLPDVRDRSLRRQTLALLSRANLLAGRVNFFDMNKAQAARAYLDLAREAAEQAADPVMTSVVFGHMAFLPAAKLNFDASASYVAAARDALSREPVALVGSWLHAVEGELNTRAGSLTPARHCLDRARAALGTPWRGPAPKWFDFYDAKRLNGFEGFTLRMAGDLAGARTRLVAALEPGPELGPKQRAVTKLDLAAISVKEGDVDSGSRLAADAATDLRHSGYATAVDRLVEVKHMIPDQRSAAARLLEESLSELS
jgi:transcriptional regulator with XRE-family HTH domain